MYRFRFCYAIAISVVVISTLIAVIAIARGFSNNFAGICIALAFT